jgi:hypothetical protein
MPPPPLMGIALLFYMQIMFVPHRRHIPPLYVTGSFNFIYIYDVRTSQEIALLFYM